MCPDACQTTIRNILYFVRLQYFITICISTLKYNTLSITQQICNKNIVKCCVCFRECFSTCHNQNSGVQMLNLHFLLWLLDWHFNLSFYSLLWQIFVRRKPTYKDVAKIINFCRTTSLYTNEIRKKGLAVLSGIHVVQKYCKCHIKLPQNCSHNIL